MRVTLFCITKWNIPWHYYNNFPTVSYIYVADIQAPLYVCYMAKTCTLPIIVAPYSCGFKFSYLDTHALGWHLYS